MNEQIWSAGVKTRTVDGALVMYPVVVSIEGKETELSLADAKRLLAGLATAVEIASVAEASARSREHVLMYGPTRTGMSFGHQSKLPLGPDEKPGAFAGLVVDEFWSACSSPEVRAMQQAFLDIGRESAK